MALISKEELEEMYWGEPGTELGAPTIAKKIGCTKTTIYNYMKKYGIPRRPPTAEGTGECFTQNTRSQISENMQGTFGGKKDVSGENNPRYGKHHTEEAKNKIRENRRSYKGENHPFYGKKHSKKAKDKISKIHSGKTGLRGEKNPMSKLPDKEVLAIYDKYKNNNITIKKLAKEYNVSYETIARITQGKHSLTKDKEHINKRKKLNKKIGQKIFKEYKETNTTYHKLAKKYKISISVISNIVNHKHWTTKHLAK